MKTSLFEIIEFALYCVCMALFVALVICMDARAAQDPVDEMKLCTKDGKATVTLTFHVEDILGNGENRCEQFKAMMKRAYDLAKKTAAIQLKAMEDEAKAQEKAEPKKKVNLERVWELHELPGKWKCAGKDCSPAAEVVPIPDNAR